MILFIFPTNWEAVYQFGWLGFRRINVERGRWRVVAVNCGIKQWGYEKEAA